MEPGTQLDTGEIVQGILAAANAGPGVVNLSLGSDEKELVIEQAIYEAVRKGTLVVAASGNDGDTGNPLGYPASIPHVLTVGASDRLSRIAGFSSRSRFVDLAAPGVGIPIATALGKGWRDGDGTSYAAPLVSGASRVGLDGAPGARRDAVVRGDAALRRRHRRARHGTTRPASACSTCPPRSPIPRPSWIRSSRTTTSSSSGPAASTTTRSPPLTMPSRRVASVQARADRAEDPRDVYRVWLPRNGTVTATLTADTNLDLSLWKQGTVSVIERIIGNDRLARAIAGGNSEKLRFANKGAGRFAYLAVVVRQGRRAAPRATASASAEPVPGFQPDAAFLSHARPTPRRTRPAGRARRPACARGRVPR